MQYPKYARITEKTETVKRFLFKSGENHVQLNWGFGNEVEIFHRYSGDGSLVQLMMLVDALRRQSAEKIHLVLPYFPGARQDRVCNPGEALSVKVYADLINSLGFASVTVFDPHSDVVAALVNNIKVVKNHDYVAKVLGPYHPSDYILVSPDAGANKKIFDLAKYLGGPQVIRADKKRDVTTGAIVETEVYADDLTGKTCVIVDDIISGGRTFKELAKKLKEKNAAHVVLIVSHNEGIADNNSLKEWGIDHLACTDSLPNGCLMSGEFMEVYDIENLIPVPMKTH